MAAPGRWPEPNSRHAIRDSIDRSFARRRDQVLRDRLPIDSAYLDDLQALDRRSHERQCAELAHLLDAPLGAELDFVNECFERADRATQGAFHSNTISSGSRARAEKIYRYRLVQGATLRDLMRADPFDRVGPLRDGPLLADLYRHPGTLPPTRRRDQEVALYHRFLHRPQRTPYVYFHEAAAGYFLHKLESGGASVGRAQLDIRSSSESELAVYLLGRVAASSGIGISELVALHAATEEEINALLPREILDLFLLGDLLFRYMQRSMLNEQYESARRVTMDIHTFFSIPSAERFVEAGGGLRLAPGAGQFIDRKFLRHVDSRGWRRQPAANELDVVRILTSLVDELWIEAA